MLPWLAHGHLSPFLELAKKLTDRNFQVYFCSTPVTLNPIKENHFKNNLISSIQFIEINLPCTQELPPNYHTTKGLPPHLMPVLKTAFDSSKEKFRQIIRLLKPDLLIYDFVQPWAPEIANQENVEAVVFTTFGPSANAFLFHYIVNPDKDFPIPEFGFPERKICEIIQFLDNLSNGLTDKERFLQCMKKSRFVIVKTLLNGVESKTLDYFSCLVGKEVVPVGSLVQDHLEIKSSDSETIFMDWLNKRDFSSVVFVSFGTEFFLSKDEIEAIAFGLELSNVCFIWVIRFPRGQNLSLDEVLPKDFQNRVEERGIVVQGWAPQAKILSHPSIGGFLSHCGWSSTLESITFGVPIIAMPMQYDQHLNARMVAYIGVGIEVQSENDKFSEDEISRVIRQVVLLDEGKDVRKRVQELSAKIKENGDQGIEVVSKKLLQLVKKS